MMDFSSLEPFINNPDLVKFLAILMILNSVVIAIMSLLTKVFQNNYYKKSMDKRFSKFENTFNELILRLDSYTKGTAEDLSQLMEITQEIFNELVKFKDENIGKQVNVFLRKYINFTLERILVENITRSLNRDINNCDEKDILDNIKDVIDTFIHTYLQNVDSLSNFNYKRLYGIVDIIKPLLEKVEIDVIITEVKEFVTLNFLRK